MSSRDEKNKKRKERNSRRVVMSCLREEP
jgi:hypothetical protein